jgi:hypothetical protein
MRFPRIMHVCDLDALAADFDEAIVDTQELPGHTASNITIQGGSLQLPHFNSNLSSGYATSNLHGSSHPCRITLKRCCCPLGFEHQNLNVMIQVL